MAKPIATEKSNEVPFLYDNFIFFENQTIKLQLTANNQKHISNEIIWIPSSSSISADNLSNLEFYILKNGKLTECKTDTIQIQYNTLNSSSLILKL